MGLNKVILGIFLSGTLVACSGDGKSSSSKSSVSNHSSSSVSSTMASSSSSSALPAPTIASIVVDQFGYLPQLKKVAIIRDAQTGYDADLTITPGDSYQIMNLDTGEVAYSGAPTPWNEGGIHNVSGDKVWWFDFTGVTTPGTYAVVDVQNNVRSPDFKIGADIYKPVLKHALRTFFYQRAGFAKQLPYADAGWTDAASHLGFGQDKSARLFNDVENAATERDLSGGWYDADEYHKYTNRHADNIIGLLHAYLENPAAWTDDFNIPESANGIADILDEVKWGLDWLIKMQEEDGSVLSVVGVSHASPPSAAAGPSRYGPASTSATLTSAAAFALGSRVLGSLGNEALSGYADELRSRAISAWTWAESNPGVIFQNNDNADSPRLAGIQQEVNDSARAMKKHLAAIYLFAATGDTLFKDFVDANYVTFDEVTPWNEPWLTSLLYYAALPDATVSVASDIAAKYAASMNASANLPAVLNSQDAYRAYLGQNNFTWGSNRTMMRKALTFYNLLSYEIGNIDAGELRNAALGYLNYIHGSNPLGLVYLSNMSSAGADYSVNEISHAWFANGSSEWDRVGVSNYGPPPGFLVVGPNPGFNWDICCPASCGYASSNALCTSISLSPPKDQPAMKSYLDFNTGWPLNSWQVAENQNDHQVAYLRLLSKYVQ